MKTNSSFKLSKQSKIHCAQFMDPHRRGAVRRSFIEAEVMKLIQPKVVKTRKDQQEQV
jgi:hypothetical protein